MLVQRSPQEAYRRVDFDARVASANSQELVLLCLEQVILATGSALVAHERGDNLLKSNSMTRALSALTALHLGVDSNGGVSTALAQFYGAARQSLLDCVLKFEPDRIASIRQDFIDINQAMSSVRQGQ